MATKAKAGDKGQQKGATHRGRTTTHHPGRSDRYTPPIPKTAKQSPKWMGILILGLFLLGVLIVILNYAGVLPGGVNNLWLIGAIGSLFAGLLIATHYH